MAVDCKTLSKILSISYSMTSFPEPQERTDSHIILHSNLPLTLGSGDKLIRNCHKFEFAQYLWMELVYVFHRLSLNVTPQFIVCFSSFFKNPVFMLNKIYDSTTEIIVYSQGGFVSLILNVLLAIATLHRLKTVRARGGLRDDIS